MHLRKTLLALLLPLAAYAEESFMIHLREPEFCDGVLKTDKGGVITAEALRIQAEKIEYTNKTVDGVKIQKIFAEGDLMMNYQGRTYVGKRVEFDLRTKTGSIVDGKTMVNIWYVGGERIELCPDGDFLIYGGSITTAETLPNFWEIRAEKATISDCTLFARDIKVQVFKVPIFWFPFYKSRLDNLEDPPLRFRILWDKGLGPRLSTRYRVYSSDTVTSYARFDYRISRGPGGALEGEYCSEDERTYLVTHNYGALDKSFPNEKGPVRYRFQGIFSTRSEDARTNLHMQWDRMSDNRMVGDFSSSDFEINTEKETYLLFSHLAENGFANVNVRPKINRFQSLNQRLPYTILGVRPFQIGNSGIISENMVTGSYLDYTYANQLEPFLRDRKAGRLETANSLYRPFSWAGLNVTPRAGVIGIFYTNSPFRKEQRQLLFEYSGDARMRFSKRFQGYKHLVEPYTSYFGYSHPKAPLDSTFIFDIYDGYFTLNQLRFGLKQCLYSRKNPFFLPAFVLDIYSYAFWGARSFTQTIPKAFAHAEINQPSYAITTDICWNFQERLLDFGNLHFLWTLSEACALGLEFRHRSSYDWRKSVHDNYVVDFARTIPELLQSPLSDRRTTVLTKAHFNISPRWSLHFQTHHGWDRISEPPYNSAKVDLITRLNGSWQMRLTYEYMPNDKFRFSYNFNLVK